MIFPAEPRVLVYTASRASGAQQVKRAFDSLHDGQKKTGASHDWLLWCNSPDTWTASELGWMGLRHRYNDATENVGQHIPLRWILDYARCADPGKHEDLMMRPCPGGESCTPRYDFIVRVDDDLEWVTTDWLRKLLDAERRLFAFSKKLAVVSANVLGLINEIQKIPLKVEGMPIYAAGITGGACRLHHLSFFEGYEPDCRRAMGAGDATTIAQHAEETHIPIFILPSVRVRHDTQKHIDRDPVYAEEHEMLQRMPYVPPWHPGVPNA